MISSRQDSDATTPILLVDDWPANLLALEAILESPEYELVSVGSGPDALTQLDQREFAVCLLDMQMPEMDGAETAWRMKRLSAERGHYLPIIFVTGIDTERSRVVHAYASGDVDFIQKPLEPSVIRSKVSVFVDLYRARRRLVAEIEERVRLQDAVRLREDLLAMVAHDLRNPLNTVLFAAKQIERLAESGESGSPVKKAASTVVMRPVGWLDSPRTCSISQNSKQDSPFPLIRRNMTPWS